MFVTVNGSPGHYPDRSASVDRVFRAVADPHRRQLLDVLVADDGRCKKRQAVVAALATEGDRSEVDVETELTHVLLPQLETAGLVETDREDERLCCPACQLVRRLLALTDRIATDPALR